MATAMQLNLFDLPPPINLPDQRLARVGSAKSICMHGKLRIQPAGKFSLLFVKRL